MSFASFKDNDPNVFKSKMDEYVAGRESIMPSGSGSGHGIGQGQSARHIPPELRGIIAQKLITIPFINRNQQILPKLLETIFNDPASADMFYKNKEQFSRNIENPQYLEMLVSRIQSEENDRRRALEQSQLSSNNGSNNGNGGGNINSDYTYQPFVNQPQSQNPYSVQLVPSNPENRNGNGNGIDFNQSGIYGNDLLLRDPHNVSNTLPKIQDIYWNEFSLLLDFNNDLRDDTDNSYSLKFYKVANISKIQLVSMVIEKTSELLAEDGIYVRIEEFTGRCFTSNQKQVFGRLIQSHYDDKYVYYYPDKETCLQVFSSPINLDHLTLEFFDSKTNPLSLKEIKVTDRFRETNKKTGGKILRLKCQYEHNFKVGDIISGYLIKDDTISTLNISIDDIIDKYTFSTADVIGRIDKGCYWKLKIFQNKVNCLLNFKLYEINWNMITGKTLENAELKKLSQLISEDEEISKIEQPIINYIMSKMN